ncbi:MAG: hypothetical protein LBK69_03030 [Syntrophomonadaceae bacterium]|jgi:hypothetical protein|nr:hypothetical protein [Syntrophomonadaceae bacterium]
MKSVLHEFYYGNIIPNEKSFVRDSEYGKTIKIVSDYEEKLLKLLNNEENELFKTFSNAQGDLNRISVADSFLESFCVGMRIAIEVMQKQL